MKADALWKNMRPFLLPYSLSYHLISIPSPRKEMRELASLVTEKPGVVTLCHPLLVFRELMERLDDGRR